MSCILQMVINKLVGGHVLQSLMDVLVVPLRQIILFRSVVTEVIPHAIVDHDTGNRANTTNQRMTTLQGNQQEQEKGLTN